MFFQRSDTEISASPLIGVDSGRHSRCADLARHVAAGRVPFPEGLSSTDAIALAARVRQILRDRLIRHVARAIAADIIATTQTEREIGDVQENI